MGWSLDTSVVRQRVTLNQADWYDGSCPCWRSGTVLNDTNDYTLLIGGQEYALVHLGGGEFVTERYAPLRIWYCASQTSCPAPHAPGPRAYITETFWVWSADGALSVFGGETETAVRITASQSNVDDVDTLTWHLRYVFAAHRDDPGQAGRWSARYSYWPVGSYRVLTQVLYGNSLGSAARHTVTLDYVDRYVGMPAKYQPLTITVRAGQTGEAIWRYGLGYGYVADRYVLTQVVKIAADGARMPATTFDYTPVCIDGASPCKTASLMTRVSNGYGGTVEYAFEPGPSANAAERRVVTETTSDGATNVAVRTFEYAQPCKNENAAVCRTYHDFGPSGYLMGYGVVTETARDSANMVLRITAHQYYTDALRLGMEGSRVSLDSAGAALTAETTAWDAQSCDAGWPDGSWLVSPLTSTRYLAGDSSSALFRRTAAQTGLTRTNCARVYQYQELPPGDKTIWTDRRPPRLWWQMEAVTLTSRYGILRDPTAGAVPLYLCAMSWTKFMGDKSEHTFLSRQADCSWPGGTYGGGQPTTYRYGTGLAGYIYSTTSGIYSQPLASCVTSNDPHHSIVAGTSCPGANLIEVLGYASPDTPSAAPLAGAALKAQVLETAESDPGGVVRRSASASAVLSTTTRWAVVGISQTVRDGAGNLLDETHAFYDDLPTFGAVAKGDLTFVQKRANGSASIDRKLSYDANGALESETLYSDYGTLGVMTNTSGVLRRTSNVFDGGTGRYVVQQRVFGADTAPQTRTVSYAYFGVGGESVTNTLGARQPVGALKAMTDANQAVTQYGYDVFGRLRRVARPGDSLTDPSEEWRYYDGIETSRTMTASGFTAGPFVTDHRVRGVAGGGWTPAFAGAGSLAILDRTIYDGLGRVIQTQTRAGQGWQLAHCADSPRQTLGTEVIQSTVYDALGRAALQTVPYNQTQYESCASPGWVNTPYVAMPQTQTQPSGTGLAAMYYNGMNFETAVLNRTDATVDFNWGNSSPGGGVSSDQFSARWTGWVRVDASATYTFYPAGDDGIRLWIDGQLVVDQWRDQGLTEYAAAMALQAGVVHALKFEYYENSGGAQARLKWASPTLAKQVIPAANLYASRVTPVVTPTVPYARTAYDALGRAITVTAADGSVSVARYGVDASGPGYAGTNLALKTMFDPNGHQTQQVSDGLGRMIRVREFTGTGGSLTLYGETRYGYDAGDRLTSVTDAAGNVTTITYDALGRKVGMFDPDMGAWRYAYNALGQLITQTDALGQTMVFTYDALGRMTGKGVGGASPSGLASYLYDQGANGIGRRTRMTDTTGYSAWTYDGRGRVINATKQINPNPASYTTLFGYDAANRLITTTYPSSEVVTNTPAFAGAGSSTWRAGQTACSRRAAQSWQAPPTTRWANRARSTSETG